MQFDDSDTGLGGTLLQEVEPIVSASRTFKDSDAMFKWKKNPWLWCSEWKSSTSKHTAAKLSFKVPVSH